MCDGRERTPTPGANFLLQLSSTNLVGHGGRDGGCAKLPRERGPARVTLVVDKTLCLDHAHVEKREGVEVYTTGGRGGEGRGNESTLERIAWRLSHMRQDKNAGKDHVQILNRLHIFGDPRSPPSPAR